MPPRDSNIVDGRSNGVVAVIVQEGRFLVIRRGPDVIAPGKICFPGGAPNAEETDRQAVEREVQEELGVAGIARREIWKSVTPWNVALSWWGVEIDARIPLEPQCAEVAWVGWMRLEELLDEEQLLESNQDFLEAVQDGRIVSILPG